MMNLKNHIRFIPELNIVQIDEIIFFSITIGEFLNYLLNECSYFNSDSRIEIRKIEIPSYIPTVKGGIGSGGIFPPTTPSWIGNKTSTTTSNPFLGSTKKTGSDFDSSDDVFDVLKAFKNSQLYNTPNETPLNKKEKQ